MHVPLIYFPVIMILSFFERSYARNIEDFSGWCSNGRDMYYYLTSGVGSSDKFVSMITEKEKNCTLKFSVKAGNNIMIVLEFPDMKSHEHICYTEKNTSVMVRDYTENEPCQRNDCKHLYYRLSKENISIHIISGGKLNAVKITATSMRDADQVSCSNTNETECVVHGKKFCMTSKTVCDGHNNCGAADSFDEDHSKCRGPQMSFIVIISTAGMTILSLCLLFSIAMRVVPQRKDPYVHSFDETRSLFDSENGIVTVDLNIIAIFPPEKASPIHR